MFTPPDPHELKIRLAAVTPDTVERALQFKIQGIEQLCALLSPAAESFLPRMAAISRQLTLQRFGRVIQLYAPIYLSNYCSNRCLYCGFAAHNRIARKVLSFEEAKQEAAILKKRGFHHILLVSGEAKDVLDTDYLADLTRHLRLDFAAVSIEVQPLSTEDYRLLFEAGITGVTVYQETYDRELYKKVHLAGKKTDFDFRLETPARACRAGMREVGIGALLGLGDWRREGLAIGAHLAWLRKHFWQTSLTVSFPRLRPAAGSFEPFTRVSEKNLSQLIFALRIFDPDVGLLLSTREEPKFRDGMLGLGPTRYSAGSCTSPGGYANPEPAGEQFSVGDHRSLEQISLVLKERGIDPVCKDWDASFQQSTVPETIT